MKGSHLSRNVEAIADVVDKSVRAPVSGLEDLAVDICKRLLDKHEYATYSEVRSHADYFLEKKSPLGRRSLERYKIMACAEALKSEPQKMKKRIGVEVIGMTACPCAMEETKIRLGMDESDVPFITHNQRNLANLMIDVPEDCDIEADDLIEIVEESFSSPTREILKRDDEAELVLRAHDNPKFVEDVVRGILGRIVEKYRNLPDDVVLRVKSESQESIHKHNAFAERVTTLGELRSHE